MDSEPQQVNTQSSATESAGLQLSNLPQSEPSLDSRPPLDPKDLIDLFKHWDTRVSQQETLFVPLAAAGLPAVAVAWKDITPHAIGAVALASIGLYLFYLFTLRRIGLFQDNIFEELKTRCSNFDAIVRRPNKLLGVRRLRALALLFLSILWAIALAAKLDESPVVVSARWYIGIAIFVTVSFILFWYLWRDTPAKN